MVDLRQSELMPGMVLAQDIIEAGGRTVLKEDTVLTEYDIAKIAYYGELCVWVKEIMYPQEPLPSRQSFSSAKQVKSYLKFKAGYDNIIGGLKDSLNDIVEKNVDIDVERMYGEMLTLSEGKTGYGIMGMLQHLRQYDDSTYTHAVNVALLCGMLAGWLNFTPQQVQLAAMCGLLHDIGKLRIPDAIIKKPGRLTEEEFDIIKGHPLAGYEVLKDRPIDEHIKLAALMHHERCDGSGYPGGLKRDEIDEFAKLVSIGDVYDAMTAARVYRGPLCPFEVIRVFEEEGFERYESRYVLTFLERVADTYINERVLLSDGRQGRIIFINRQCISRPLVRCGTQVVDLSLEKDLYVARIL